MPVAANSDDILLNALTEALSRTTTTPPDELISKTLRGCIKIVVKTCLRLSEPNNSNPDSLEDGGYAVAARLLEKLFKALRKVKVQHLDTCVVLIPVYADCIRILSFTLLPSPPHSPVKRPLQSPTQIVQHIFNSIICLSSAHPSLSSIAKHAIHQIGTYISKFLRNLASIQMELVHSAALNYILQFCNLTCQIFDEPKTNSLSVLTLSTMSAEKLFHWVRTGTSLEKLLMTRFLLPLLEHAVIASDNWELASQLILRLYDQRIKSDYGLSDWLISCASSQRFSHSRHFFDAGGSTPDESTLISIDGFLNLRLFSVRVLGEFPSNHIQITLTLLALLNDASREVRDFAARALSQRSLAGSYLKERSDSRKTDTGCLAAVHLIRMHTSPSVGCYLRDMSGVCSNTPFRDVRWEKVKFSNPYKCLLQVLQDRWMSRDRSKRYPDTSLRENESFGLWAKYISRHLWTCPIHLQHPRWKEVCRKLVGTLAKGLLLFALECNWENESSSWLCVASIVEAVLLSSCFQPSYPSCDDIVLKVFQPLLKRMRASENEQAQKACVMICWKLLGRNGDTVFHPKEPPHYGAVSTLYSILRVNSPLDCWDSAMRLRVESMLQKTYPIERFVPSRPINVTPSKRNRSPIRTNATMTGTENGNVIIAERSKEQQSVRADCNLVGRNGERIVRRRTDQFENSNRKRAGKEKGNEPTQKLDSKEANTTLRRPQIISVDRSTCTRLNGDPVSRSGIRRKKYFGRDFSPVKKVCFSDVDNVGDVHFMGNPVSSNFTCESDTFPPPHERFDEVYRPTVHKKYANRSHDLNEDAHIVADPVSSSIGCASVTFPPPHERFDELHASRRLAHKSKNDITSRSTNEERFSDMSTTSFILESTMTTLQQEAEFSFIDDHFDPLAGLQADLNKELTGCGIPQIKNRSSKSTSTCSPLSAENQFVMTTGPLNGKESGGSSAVNSQRVYSSAEALPSSSSELNKRTPKSAHRDIPVELTGSLSTTDEFIPAGTSTMEYIIRNGKDCSRWSRPPESVAKSPSAGSGFSLTESGEMVHSQDGFDQTFCLARRDGHRPVVYDQDDLKKVIDFRYQVVPNRLAGDGNHEKQTTDEDGMRSIGIDIVQEAIPWTEFEGETHGREGVQLDGAFVLFTPKGICPEIRRDKASESDKTLIRSNSVVRCEGLPNVATDHTSVLPSASFSFSLQSLQSKGRQPVPSFPPNLIRDRVQICIRKLLKTLKTRQQRPLEIHPLLFEVFGVEPGLLVDACSGMLSLEATAGDEASWLEQLESISRRLVPLSQILRTLEIQLRAPISLAQALIIVRDQIALSAFSAGNG